MFPAKTPFFERSRSKVLNHDINCRHQFAHNLAGCVGFEVERDGLFVSALAVPPERSPIMHLAPFAQGVTLSRGLDLDHLGAELGQDRGRVRACDQRSEFKYPNARERA